MLMADLVVAKNFRRALYLVGSAPSGVDVRFTAVSGGNWTSRLLYVVVDHLVLCARVRGGGHRVSAGDWGTVDSWH